MHFRAATLFIIVALAPLLADAQEGATTFSVVRDKILAPVWVNGAGPYPFILDLGIKHPVLSRTVGDALGLKPSPTEQGQGIALAVEIQELRIDKAASKPLQVLMMDLSPFKTTLGTEVAGIFSGREIGDELRLDFAANALTVRQLSGEGSLPTDTRSVRLRLDENNQPVVSVLLDGKHVRSFLVDTTLGGALGMPEQALRDLGLLTDDTPHLAVENLSTGDANSQPLSEKMQIRLKSVRVGSAEVQDPVCSVLPSAESPRLGLEFLKNFGTIFDFEEKLLRLEHTGKLPIVAGPIVGCGLTPARFVDGYWTVWVALDSPASKAGIQTGAILAEVNGKDLKDADYASVARKLTVEEGDVLSVTLGQAKGGSEGTPQGEQRTIALAAKRLL
jgi:membrane-associated protease RseP (regulator of RpoE activity)